MTTKDQVNSTSVNTEEAQKTEQNFSVVSIYTKDISVETPNSPHIFREEWKPKVDFDLQMSTQDLGDNMYESTLSVTITTTLPETAKPGNKAKTAFLVEVNQAGVFSLRGFSKEDIDFILATTAQEILFPYARESVSSLVIKSGFPQMLLPPVNFNALYQEHKAKAKSDVKEEVVE